MGLALLLVLDYRGAETVFTEPLLLGTVVGGDWGIPGLAPSPKPSEAGMSGQATVTVSSGQGPVR